MDGVTLSVIRGEIEGYLPLKVQKVQQPGKKEVAFSLWSPSARERLVLSLEGNDPFFGFSDERRENPAVPPGFCLALRKRLEGGTLVSIRQEGLDRVLYFDFDGHDDFGGRTRFVLVFDMAGRAQNIGLYRDGLLEAEMSAPDGERFEHGAPYTPPPGGQRVDPLTLGEAKAISATEDALRLSGDVALRALPSAVEGIGKELARSILAQAGQDASSTFTGAGASAAVAVLATIGRALKEKSRPSGIYIGPSAAVFHVFPLVHLELEREFGTALEGARVFRASNLESQEYSSLKAYVEALHRKVLKKVQSRHDAQVQDLMRGQDYAKYRVWAQLIDTSGKRLPPGATEMTVTDYYADPPLEKTVPLDPRYSSRDNARNYYRTFAKLARAEKVLRDSALSLEESLARIHEVRVILESAASVFDLMKAASRTEALAKAEGIPARPPRRRIRAHVESGAARGSVAPSPVEPAAGAAEGPDGALFFVGGSAKQNDYLVTRVRKPGDVWLHAKGVKGAHVLARPPAGGSLSDAALLAAASLAAGRSGASGATKVEVDYVDAMRVRKPRGGAPGFVTFTGQKTIVVSPETSGRQDGR